MGQARAKEQIFLRVRQRIAEALSAEGIDVRKDVGMLEMAIGTFAPSAILTRFQVSDYPFIGARYVSLRDGGVYIVAGATDDAKAILAYRLGFLRSAITHRGGLAVGITEDGWMDSGMVLFSLIHAGFEQSAAGDLTGIDDDAPTRRTFPLKKLKAYGVYWKRRLTRKH